MATGRFCSSGVEVAVAVVSSKTSSAAVLDVFPGCVAYKCLLRLLSTGCLSINIFSTYVSHSRFLLLPR